MDSRQTVLLLVTSQWQTVDKALYAYKDKASIEFICSVLYERDTNKLITVCDLWPFKPLTPRRQRKGQMGLWLRGGDILFSVNVIVFSFWLLFLGFPSVFNRRITSFSRNLTISIENNTTFQSGCIQNQKACPWWLNYSVREAGVPQHQVILSFEPPKVDRIWSGKVPLWAFWPQTLSIHHFMFNNNCDTFVSAQNLQLITT